MEHRVGNTVLDENFALGHFAFVFVPELFLSDDLAAKLGGGHLVTPVTEGPLGELHDVTLVHYRDRMELLVDRVVYRLAHQSLGADY